MEDAARLEIEPEGGEATDCHLGTPVHVSRRGRVSAFHHPELERKKHENHLDARHDVDSTHCRRLHNIRYTGSARRFHCFDRQCPIMGKEPKSRG
jgi:hypothetical protein